MRKQTFIGKSNRSMHLFLTLLMLFFVVSGKASTTYYYTATADLNNTAGGKVYVSENSTSSPAYDDKAVSFNSNLDGWTSDGGAWATNHFYATNKEGYTFSGWKDSNGDIVSTNTHYTASDWVTGTRYLTWGGWKIDRTPIKYTAIFDQITGLVQAYTTDATRGSVTISNPNNVLNENVVITAIPDASQGIKFLGWGLSRNQTSDYITTNPYNLTVTGYATYYAFFSDPATMVYCILKNHETGRYLSLYGNVKASNHTTKVSGQTVIDGFDFTNGFKMISESQALGNPMTVFKRKSTLVGGVEEGDLATDVQMISGNNTTKISISSLIDYTNHTDLIFEPQNDGTYLIYTNITSGDYTYPSFLYDNSSKDDWAHLRSTNDMGSADQKRIYWDVYFLTEDQVTGAFGANAKSKYTQDNKYYTTMYAPFAYRLLDGVTAYYLPFSNESYNEEHNTVVFKEIASGSIVPANTAVILECQNADDPTANRLLPVSSDESTISVESNQLLKGYTQIFSSKNQKQNTVPNSELRYVLSIKNDKLGFYHYSGSNMNPNKAYLELPATLDKLAEYLEEHNADNLAKTVKFSFGETTGIKLSNIVVDDADAPIFDLQGRKIQNPSTGIYVKKGKKFVVK